MKSALLSFLLVAILLTFSTLVGMAVFGMSGTTAHMDMGTSGTDCLDQCLSVASSVSTVVIPLPFVFAGFVVVVALLVAAWLPVSSSYRLPTRRWREGIGKLLLQQNLSTVILRD